MTILEKPKKAIYQDMGKDIPNVMKNEMDDVHDVTKRPRKNLINEVELK